MPSVLAFLMLPVLAFSSADRPATRLQERRQPQQNVPTVIIKDSSFDPAERTATVGQTVVWNNTSARDHNIVIRIDERTQVRSGNIKRDGTWSYKFEKPGTYSFHCSIHPRAKGVVKVTPAERG